MLAADTSLVVTANGRDVLAIRGRPGIGHAISLLGHKHGAQASARPVTAR